jgi:GWxTD domain-containing protein
MEDAMIGVSPGGGRTEVSMSARDIVRARILPAAGVLLLAVAAGNALAANKPKLDPESAKFYRSARLIMTKEEIKIFNHLPDAASRKEFIADFWLKRDPDPDTPGNEFKSEFEARVAFINKRFNKEGGPAINTDRGRVYIFMGPPDKVEESNVQDASRTSGGAVLWWIYYNHELGVEFTDKTGTGKFVITDISGDFFGAMDLMKLGQNIRADDVFAKKFVKFETVYDAAAQQIEVRLPVKGLMFRDNDEGRLEADLRFIIYIYSDEGSAKETLQDARSVVLTDAEHESQKTVNFRFAKPLKPGTNFVDVIVMGKEGTQGKIRQIFEIKVRRS